MGEAEKLRHGQKAATVTGLKNESTGDTVDLDVPARRYATDLIRVCAVVVVVDWLPVSC